MHSFNWESHHRNLPFLISSVLTIPEPHKVSHTKSGLISFSAVHFTTLSLSYVYALGVLQLVGHLRLTYVSITQLTVYCAYVAECHYCSLTYIKPMQSPSAEAHAPGNKVGACHFSLILAPCAFFQLSVSPPKPSLPDQLSTDMLPSMIWS